MGDLSQFWLENEVCVPSPQVLEAIKSSLDSEEVLTLWRDVLPKFDTIVVKEVEYSREQIAKHEVNEEALENIRQDLTREKEARSTWNGLSSKSRNYLLNWNASSQDDGSLAPNWDSLQEVIHDHHACWSE